MIDALIENSWPGNIRELEGVIERALISTAGHSVLTLPGPLQSTIGIPEETADLSGDEDTDLSSIERSHILRVLQETTWMIAGNNGAASALGMPPSTLRSKMKRLGISRESS